MGLLSKLFKREHSPPLPDVNDMSIADVWIEFSTKVKYKNGVLLTAYIQSNGWHEMTKWFAPPTDCPVAKAIMRTLVRLNREGHFLSSGLELAYVADAPSLPKTRLKLRSLAWKNSACCITSPSICITTMTINRRTIGQR